tara:strand:- start:564 stop:932 length:369 start_codon:yes stop_codon:yes gene_type:complete
MAKQLPAEFLTQEEFAALPDEQETNDIVTTDWEAVLEKISQPGTRLAIPTNKDFNRKDVVKAFSNAFELIGGVPRLALWAHSNEGDFFKLYSRLLPSQASSALGESNEMIVRHVLPKGPLDE